ncbi:hypothetical protein T11_6786 [Trichinella zimbabwensis]|uniref:Uncharacterized protein n=1 Tax=Trichinella zimbabwensis TaxID=268475 RepID=A0A0V1GRU6_9BILA|nr:hypothetical protein T11_17513 [Trichinella zimbabwensis]KRZ00933.1 hypothetical protein T11_6786 [Trichinella zimbabwensis]
MYAYTYAYPYVASVETNQWLTCPLKFICDLYDEPTSHSLASVNSDGTSFLFFRNVRTIVVFLPNRSSANGILKNVVVWKPKND